MQRTVTTLVLCLMLVAGIFALGASPVLAKPSAKLDPSTTAVVLVDFQNDFVSPDGRLYKTIEKELARRGTLAKTAALVKAARKRGVRIIHVTAGYSPTYAELGDVSNSPFHAYVKAVRTFVKGTKGVEIYEPLKPGPNDTDIVLPGRTAMSGFNGTELDQVLRAFNIKTVAVGGFMTDICTEATARSAYDRGYNVILLKETTATRTPEFQAYAENRIYRMLGKILSNEEFLAMLPAKTAMATGK